MSPWKGRTDVRAQELQEQRWNQLKTITLGSLCNQRDQEYILSVSLDYEVILRMKAKARMVEQKDRRYPQ